MSRIYPGNAKFPLTPDGVKIKIAVSAIRATSLKSEIESVYPGVNVAISGMEFDYTMELSGDSTQIQRVATWIREDQLIYQV